MARPPPIDSPLALLIDADNTPYGAMKNILDESARYGRAIIRKAYGDWSNPILHGWQYIFREYAIRPMQQISYTSGKNATDSALIIDAMDIMHEGKVETFVLVTSDSDFTSLAMRIREGGFSVIGIGRQTTPPSFVKGCDRFVPLETLGEQTDTGNDIIAIPSVKNPSTDIEDMKARGRELLLTASTKGADERGIISGAELGIMLRRIDPSFAPMTYGAIKLSDFVGQYPDIIKPTGKTAGNLDPTYKLTEDTERSKIAKI